MVQTSVTKLSELQNQMTLQDEEKESQYYSTHCRIPMI